MAASMENAPNQGGAMSECFKMVDIEGVKFPSFYFLHDPQQHIAAMRNMEVRPDDVFLCAWPKSGTHWTWEMCSMLCKGKAEYDSNSKINLMMDFMSIDSFSSMPSPRMINSHHYFRFLPYRIREVGARVILISRNPKDILVSHFHHRKGMEADKAFKGDFAEFLQSMMTPGTMFGWFDYMRDWEKVMSCLPDLKLLHLQYEDMKEDTAGTVRQLNQFLGTGASDSLCSEIAAACHISKLKVADRNKLYKFHGFLSPEFIRQGGFFRKGEVGDWKNWFTVAQSEAFDQLLQQKMAGSDLVFRYAL